MALQTILFGVFVVPQGKIKTRKHRVAGAHHVEIEDRPQPTQRHRQSPVRDRIVKTLAKHPGLTSKQLATKAGIKVEGVRTILCKLMDSEEAYRLAGTSPRPGGGRGEHIYFLKGTK